MESDKSEWTRILVKRSTHEKAKECADKKGLKLWMLIDKAVEEYLYNNCSD